MTVPETATADVERTSTGLRLWGVGDAILTLGLLAVTAPSLLLLLVWRVPGQELDPWLEQDFVVPAAVGAALGLCVGGVASWLRRRTVIWWAPAGIVCAALLAALSAGINGAAVLATAGAALAVSVLVRSAMSRGQRLLLPDRIRRWCVFGATAATVAVGAMVGTASVVCTQPTHTYRVLRSDPMDAEQLPGLELDYSASADQGSFFGTTAPKVKTTWRIVDGTTQTQMVRGLGRHAVERGWTIQDGDESCDYRRTTDGVHMCLAIRPTTGPGRVAIEIWPEEWRPEPSRC